MYALDILRETMPLAMLGYELVIDDEIASALLGRITTIFTMRDEPALIGDVIPSVGKDGCKGELMQSSTFASVFHLLFIICFSSPGCHRLF